MSSVAEMVKGLAESFEVFKTNSDRRIDALHAALNRTGRVNDVLEALTKAPSPGHGYVDSVEGALHVKAFCQFMRSGEAGRLQELEAKALAVGSDPDGGYLVTPDVSNRIVEKLFETSPIRELATVETTTSPSWEYIIDDDEAASGWVGETEARSETATPQVKKGEIVIHELYAEPRATQKILDDARINLEAWLGRKVGSKFGRDEATAFVTGDGVKKPRGFLTYPHGTAWGQIEQVASGDANTLTPDGLISLETALKVPYRARATWLMSRATVSIVRKFKEATTEQYLWQPGLAQGQPPTLLGYPVRLAEDMPTVGANALPIAFGDFREGYTVVDRIGIRILRDAYTAKPYVKFYTTKRVGGDVTNFEAIKLQKVATTV
jgi:HK97 family phage major capsid protein